MSILRIVYDNKIYNWTYIRDDNRFSKMFESLTNKLETVDLYYKIK